MKLEGSQKSAIGPYPEPVQPSPEPHMTFLEDLFSTRYSPVIIIPITFSPIAMNKSSVCAYQKGGRSAAIPPLIHYRWISVQLHAAAI